MGVKDEAPGWGRWQCPGSQALPRNRLVTCACSSLSRSPWSLHRGSEQGLDRILEPVALWEQEFLGTQPAGPVAAS